MKDQLIQIIKDVKPQGLFRSIKRQNIDIHTNLIQIQITNNLSSYSEAIYWILNDLQTKPTCYGYSDKCTHNLRFISLIEGYSDCCQQCTMKNPNKIQKMKNTMIEKYGVDNIAKLKSTQEKKKQTCLEKYGVESSNQVDSIKQKKKETVTKHYGDIGMAHPDITSKKIQTNLKIRGEKWATQTEETQNRRKDTCQVKYGVDNVMLLDEVKNKIRKSLIDDDFLEYVSKLVSIRGFDLISEYDHAHTNITIRCLKCNHEFNILWNSFQQGGGVCPSCFPSSSGFSKQEKDIVSFIQSLNISTIENDRTIIQPYELDIVVPSKKIAFEYCGLWCHSSGGNIPFVQDKNYHKKKLQLANVSGYQLITIFEDEWLLMKDIVQSKLKYLLGYHNDMRKIRASKCSIQIIDYTIKHNFLNMYHLQKDKVSQINLGLFYNNELVSVMTFSSKSEGVFELDRFCNKTDNIIYGAASKLLKYFKQNYSWVKIISYADMRWSAGTVYNKLGFVLDSICEPNYWYWGRDIKGRKHRLNYSKSKLKKFPNYDINLTEFQIMSLEKYAWVYDCGNLKFIMENK